MRKVLLRADADHNTGWGHIARMTALYDFLKDEFDVKLITKAKGSFESIQVVQISDDMDFFDLIDNSSIVVLDGYQFDIGYQKKIKGFGATLVCIDDYQHTAYVADMIINHAPGVTEFNLKKDPKTICLLGPKYSILNSVFLDIGHSNKKTDKQRVFLCFGGSDIYDQSFRFAEALLHLKKIDSVQVVLGKDYQGKCDTLKDPKLDIIKNISRLEVKEKMLRSTLAIVPSSTILVECLSQGIPCISGYYIANQQSIYQGYADLGFIVPIGDFNSFDLENLSDKIDEVEMIDTEKIRTIFDGKSGNRILEQFKKLS